MTVETLLYAVLALLLVIALAWTAKYIIDTFFPANLQMPASFIVGVLLILVLVVLLLRLFPGVVK
jgi:hypothetical protein